MRPAFIFCVATWVVFSSLVAPDVMSQVDRSTPPPPGPTPTLRLPDIQRLQLSNGLSVILLEKHEVPVVQLTLLVRSGIVDDPADKRGVARMTMEMLDEGAGTFDALALADAVDYLGATLSTSAGYHRSTIELFTPLSKLDDALPLFADVILRPSFPVRELNRLRTEQLTDLVQSYDEPEALASALFDKTLYGSDHPYGSLAWGDEHSLKTMTVDDLKQFYATFFHPSNAALIVVGDVRPGDLQQKLERILGVWSGGPVQPADVKPGRQVKGRAIYLVDKPGAAQSVIYIGRIGAPRNTEDYYSLVVLNTLLGGSFTSRLNQNLREDKGYTYGARSTFQFRPVAGPFRASASVQTAVTGAALVEFMKELKGIGDPVPDEELQRARNYEALQFPRRFQTVSQVAAQLVDWAANGLPDDYFSRYQEHVLAVSQAQVRDATHKYVDPDNLAIIIVGDRKEIEEQVRATRLGTIHFLTAEDVLGPIPALTERTPR